MYQHEQSDSSDSALTDFMEDHAAMSIDNQSSVSSVALDDHFMQYSYKVEACMLSHPHGWKVCPYVHPGEPVKRRHPSTHRGDMCPAVKKGLHCQVGPDNCPYAHNSFELWLHPSRYKTKMCRKGAACPRGICFFAHSAEEVRNAFRCDRSAAIAVPTCSMQQNGMWQQQATPASQALPSPVALQVPALPGAAAAASAAPWTAQQPVQLLGMANGGRSNAMRLLQAANIPISLPVMSTAIASPTQQQLLVQQQISESQHIQQQQQQQLQQLQQQIMLLKLTQNPQQQADKVCNSAAIACSSDSGSTGVQRPQTPKAVQDGLVAASRSNIIAATAALLSSPVQQSLPFPEVHSMLSLSGAAVQAVQQPLISTASCGNETHSSSPIGGHLAASAQPSTQAVQLPRATRVVSSPGVLNAAAFTAKGTGTTSAFVPVNSAGMPIMQWAPPGAAMGYNSSSSSVAMWLMAPSAAAPFHGMPSVMAASSVDAQLQLAARRWSDNTVMLQG